MRVLASVLLTEVVEREGEQYVSTCLELGTSSCGDTIEEALSNLEDAIGLHLNALEDIGDRDRIFQERGIVVSDGEAITMPMKIPVGKILRASRHEILTPA